MPKKTVKIHSEATVINATLEGFCDLIETLAELQEWNGENPFRVKALKLAADKLRAEAGTLEQGNTFLNDLAIGKLKVSGVGEGIRGHLKEYLVSGALSAVVEAKASLPKGFIEFVQLPGIGPKKARFLADDLQLTSLAELAYACQENRLLSVKGFGEKVQSNILKSIEKIKSNSHKLLLVDALDLSKEILSMMFSGGIHLMPVGELARQCEVIESLEYLVTNTHDRNQIPDLHDVVEKIIAKRWPQWILLKKAEIQNGFCDEFSTCSSSVKVFYEGDFLSLIAGARWYELNGHKVPQGSSLKTCIEVLGPPSWWEDHWVERNPSPSAYQRQKHGSVKGLFHNHTLESDGRNSLEEMVLAAERMGLQYIGISDHSVSAFYAKGLDIERIRQQRSDIKALQKRVAIRIFHGIESDILADGALDYSDEILSEFDFVVGSIHSRFKMDASEMTERLKKALSHPMTTFWGHPTGRLLLGRDGYEMNWDIIWRTLKENQVIVELNAHPQRLDIDWRWGQQIEEAGLSISIHADAHSVAGLNDFSFGEMMAEKSMIPRDYIFNLQTVDDVEQYLFDRKKKAQRSG